MGMEADEHPPRSQRGHQTYESSTPNWKSSITTRLRIIHTTIRRIIQCRSDHQSMQDPKISHWKGEERIDRPVKKDQIRPDQIRQNEAKKRSRDGAKRKREGESKHAGRRPKPLTSRKRAGKSRTWTCVERHIAAHTTQWQAQNMSCAALSLASFIPAFIH